MPEQNESLRHGTGDEEPHDRDDALLAAYDPAVGQRWRDHLGAKDLLDGLPVVGLAEGALHLAPAPWLRQLRSQAASS